MFIDIPILLIDHKAADNNDLLGIELEQERYASVDWLDITRISRLYADKEGITWIKYGDEYIATAMEREELKTLIIECYKTLDMMAGEDAQEGDEDND
jgi:hypothetical protein